MDFLTFLGKYEKENVEDVKNIVESKKTMEDIVIAEAFKSEYPSKKEALFNIEHCFMNESLAPDSVDVAYVSENLEALKGKVESLTEGDIRIIIHNHEAPKDKGGSVEYEEGAPAKKRGRPKKGGAVDKPTAIVNDPMVAEEAPEEVDEACGDDHEVKEEDDKLIDKATGKDVDGKETVEEESVEDETEEVEESDLKWSDIEQSISEEEDEDSDKAIEELAKMNLTDSELKSATSIAEDGTIEECGDERMAKAAKIIARLKKD